MVHLDRYGLPLSTTSSEATEAYREGIDRTLSAWPGAAEAFDRAIADDPDFALAHIARARVHSFYQQGEAARKEAARARELAARNGTEREKSHVETLALAAEGGGSHAQREIIEDTFIVALIRAGELPRARTLLDSRLHRRPSPRDRRWLNAAA